VARKDSTILIAVPAGEPMPASADHRVAGDDLLVMTAEITPETTGEKS
jgi:hypothetical protein